MPLAEREGYASEAAAIGERLGLGGRPVVRLLDASARRRGGPAPIAADAGGDGPAHSCSCRVDHLLERGERGLHGVVGTFRAGSLLGRARAHRADPRPSRHLRLVLVSPCAVLAIGREPFLGRWDPVLLDFEAGSAALTRYEIGQPPPFACGTWAVAYIHAARGRWRSRPASFWTFCQRQLVPRGLRPLPATSSGSPWRGPASSSAACRLATWPEGIVAADTVGSIAFIDIGSGTGEWDTAERVMQQRLNTPDVDGPVLHRCCLRNRGAGSSGAHRGHCLGTPTSPRADRL